MPSRQKLAPSVLLLGGVTVLLIIWAVAVTLFSQGGLEAIVVTVIALSFAAFSVPRVIVVLRRQRHALASAGPDVGGGVEGPAPRRRVTAIGWTALALSIAAPLLFIAAFWTFGKALEYASQPDPPFGAVIWPWVLLLWFLDVLATTVVCSIAGTRGRGNRIVGVVGGLVLLSPILLIGLESLIESAQYGY